MESILIKQDNVAFFPAQEGDALLVVQGVINLYLRRTDQNGKAVGRRIFIAQVAQNDVIFPLPDVAQGEDRAKLEAVPMSQSTLSKIPVSQVDIETACRWIRAACEMLGQRKAEIDCFCASISPQQLEVFNDRFLQRACALTREKEQKMQAANRVRYINEENFMSSGLDNLVMILHKKRGQMMLASYRSIGDPLLEACAAVAAAQKMTVNIPFALKNGTSSTDPLGDIAQASHFRTREVLLDGEWHRRPNGPLLAFRRDTHQPVALLPAGSRGYLCYDPQTQESVALNQAVADTLEAKAVMFYRSLPMYSLKAKDVLRFTLAGTGKRDWMSILLMGMGGGLLGMLTPEIIGKVFDTVIPSGDRSMMIQIGFLMVAMALTTFAFELTRAFAMQRIEGVTVRDLQCAVWDRLLSLPVSFFKNYAAGELTECAMSISQIHKIVSGTVVNTLISGIFSVFFLIVLFRKGGKLAWIGLLVLVIIVGISLLMGYLQLKHEKKLLDISNDVSGRMFGWLNGLAKIKMAGAERRVLFHWSNLFSESRRITLRNQNLGAVMEIFHAAAGVLMAIVLYFSVFKLQGVTIATGTFIAFYTALEKLLESSLKVSQAMLDANVIIPLYGKVRPIFEAVPEYDDQKADAGRLRGDIELSHINFRYDPDGPMVINDVSLHIRSGEHIALVGPSGSGKSTLFRILLGFEKPESGQIFFDGTGADQLDIRSIRRQLGVVLQSGQLLTGSIFENIVGSNPSLTQDDVMRAIRQAGMEEDISEMPMGLHTVVTEGASTLSGGQRQRLLIARALAANPSILFFDEATSALDNNTQKIVSDSINRLDATRITIAHRLSTVLDCDRIVVLESGVITQQGTYDQLMALDGTFAGMARRQIV